MDQPHRVVVVGGGFGGLSCAQALDGADTDVTLIDQRNHHLFQPLLYQVATTILPTSEVAWPLRRLFRRRPEVTTLMATVVDIDREARAVILADGSRVPFDTLVIATGSTHSYFGNDRWEAVAPGLKTIEDATEIRRRILSGFEAAERATDEAERDANLTFAVIGAGPTGVELVGIIAELAHNVLPGEFRRIDTRDARILLLEAGDRVLSTFPDSLSDYASRALERLGVEIRTGAAVTDIDRDGLVVGEQRIAVRTVIWAAGVKASPAADWLGTDADKAGRVRVEPDLSIPGDPAIFVVGDTAAVQDPSGDPVPGIAPAAKQQGTYVGKRIRQRLRGDDRTNAFRYRHHGDLATIGPGSAVADFGRIRLRGSIAWWVWGIAHIYFLIGTRSRLVVAYSWLWSYLTGQKSARLITRGAASPDTEVALPAFAPTRRSDAETSDDPASTPQAST